MDRSGFFSIEVGFLFLRRFAYLIAFFMNARRASKAKLANESFSLGNTFDVEVLPFFMPLYLLRLL